MTGKTLGDILGPPRPDGATLRWEAVVPIATNPFMLLELFQFALVGAGVAVVLLCTGVWFTEGGLALADVEQALAVGGMLLAAAMVGFVLMSLLFFGNRYYAVYRIDAGGIYHEGRRGRDESGGLISLRCKPYPVTGAVASSGGVRSRHLSWEKVDHFQDIPSMRVVILRRGRWHLLRLYTPDAETHARVTACLSARLGRG